MCWEVVKNGNIKCCFQRETPRGNFGGTRAGLVKKQGALPRSL
nr:MAG TPA: hypothetical protein [Caudoviricetes sp.]